MNSRFSSAQQGLRNVVSDAEALLDSVGNEGRSGARDVQERIVDALEAAKDRLARMDDTVRQSARYAADTTDDFVRDRPWQTAGVAVIFGLLAGYLLTRRR